MSNALLCSMTGNLCYNSWIFPEVVITFRVEIKERAEMFTSFCVMPLYLYQNGFFLFFQIPLTWWKVNWRWPTIILPLAVILWPINLFSETVVYLTGAESRNEAADKMTGWLATYNRLQNNSGLHLLSELMTYRIRPILILNRLHMECKAFFE